jgi:hypothetical protein
MEKNLARKANCLAIAGECTHFAISLLPCLAGRQESTKHAKQNFSERFDCRRSKYEKNN